MKKIIILISSSITLILLYLGIPVYQFYAHNGKVPMPSWGFVPIPTESPSDSKTEDSLYLDVSKQAIELLKTHKNNINAPAISAAVAIDNKQVWAGAVGWANIARQQPATINTQFRIGSTSKALTATGLARMVKTNTLNLDNPVSDYLRSLPNSAWADITSRQLASHMAGLPHYKENDDYLGLYQTISLTQHYDNVKNALDIFDESHLLFSPGEQFHYSSLGIVLLSVVMQEAAKHPYQTIMQEQVLTPLGMQATQAEPENITNANIATFYWNNDGRSTQVREWRKVDLSHRLAGGGFISTPSDLVKLGLGFIDPEFIPIPIRQQFWTPQTLNNGEINEQYYAIGWRIHQSDFGQGIGQLSYANHGGVSKGSQSWLMVIPDYHMVVSVNINANTEVFWDFASVAKELAQIFILAKQRIHTTKNQSTD